MGDVKFDSWVALAWREMHTIIQKRTKSVESKTAIDSFLMLPDHIQYLVLAAGAQQPESTYGDWDKPLAMLLYTLPQSVHPCILTAFAGADKTVHLLCMESRAAEKLFFQALNSLPADPPSIQGLVESAHFGNFRSEKEADSRAGAVAAALRRHTGLTSLHLAEMCLGVRCEADEEVHTGNSCPHRFEDSPIGIKALPS